MTTFDRLETLSERLGYRSVRAFAQDLGVNSQIFYDLKSGKCKTVSRDVLYKIGEKYKNVNLQWITSGNGTAFEGEQPAGSEEIESLKKIIHTQEQLIESLREQVAIYKNMVKSNSREQEHGQQQQQQNA